MNPEKLVNIKETSCLEEEEIKLLLKNHPT